MAQLNFSDFESSFKKKVTRREQFLLEMETVVPWNELVEIIRPFYPLGKTGRPPMPLVKMLKVYFMQQWFGLSDPGMEEALYDMESIRRFAGFQLNEDAIPDESTILLFRHLLEKHDLTEKIFHAVTALLESKGLMLKRGTIVDATIIHAPSSTKNIKGERDPEMRSTKTGNQWYFGMKAHVGVDTKYGIVHTMICTAANTHDSAVMDELLHGKEARIYGDKAYVGEERKQQYAERGVAWRIHNKAGRGQKLTEHEELQNQRRSRVRSLVEHPFGVVKNTWGHRKVRYRGIYKNQCQFFSLFALSNLYMMRHFLLPVKAPSAG